MSKEAQKTQKVPYNACQLVAEGPDVFSFAADENGEISKLNITAYSGKVISNHWWWGNLVIDLAGMSFPKTKFPLLWSHRVDQPVGYSSRPKVTEDSQLKVENGTLMDTEDAVRVKNWLSQGFPLQASIYATPSKIERIPEGTFTMINGQKLRGPLTVWRKSTYKETSVCVFGYDSNTETRAFTDQTPYFNLEVAPMSMSPFDVESFKAQDPEGYTAFTQTLTGPLAAQITEKDARITQLTAELTAATTALSAAQAQAESLSNENKSTIDRLSRLEKENALRREMDLRAQFSAVIQDELNKSGIPTSLHTKFSACLSMEQFIEGDDRKLNVAKLKEATKAEAVEWQNAFSQPSVLGGGGTLATSPIPEGLSDSPEAITAFAEQCAAHLSTEGNKSDILGF